MSELTVEQFQKDCEIVLACFGEEHCNEVWMRGSMEDLGKNKSYDYICQWFAGSPYSVGDEKRPAGAYVMSIARAVYARETSQGNTV